MSSPLYSPLCRNWHLLHGGCVLRREDCVFSSEDACSDEKIAFSRRRMRAPTRRCVFSSEDACSDEKMRFLVGEGVLRREECVFSSERARSNEKMACSRRRMRALA